MHPLAIGLMFVSVIGCSDRPLPFPNVGDGAVAPVDLARPPSTLLPIEQTCVMMASCGFSDLTFIDVESCLNQLQAHATPSAWLQRHLSPDVIDCIANAPDCTTAESCLNGGMPQQECPTQPQCNGPVLVECFTNSHLTNRFDCGLLGQTCVQGTGTADCGLSACPMPPPPPHPYLCDGNRQVQCVSGILHLLDDCAALGATCTVEAGGEAVCTGVPPLPACNPTDPAWCDGVHIATCPHGTPEFMSCPAGCLDGKCIQGAPCAAAAHCDGTTLYVCGPRGQLEVDCLASGFTGCDGQAGGRCTR